jgi:hypothetical protein
MWALLEAFSPVADGDLKQIEEAEEVDNKPERAANQHGRHRSPNRLTSPLAASSRARLLLGSS